MNSCIVTEMEYRKHNCLLLLYYAYVVIYILYFLIPFVFISIVIYLRVSTILYMHFVKAIGLALLVTKYNMFKLICTILFSKCVKHQSDT